MKKTNSIIAISICSIFLLIASSVDAQSPNWTWAKGMGGWRDDRSTSIAVDASGNVYTTGFFERTADFDPGPGKKKLTSLGPRDIFISKLDSLGHFVWVKQLGGTDIKDSWAIAIDGSGNVYTTGMFYGTVDFDPGTGTYNLTSLGYDDIFICKLDSSGNFIWAKQMGGTNQNEAVSLTIDNAGNIYTTGNFSGICDFDPNAGVYNLISSSSPGPNLSVFVSKLDSLGNFVWAKSLDGIGLNSGNSIITDALGNVYTTGLYEGTIDLDPALLSTCVLSSAGFEDIFISKLDSSGNFEWGKGIGAAARDLVYSIVTDAFGNVYTTGSFELTVDFDPGPGIFNVNSLNGGNSVFILKLDNNGNFVWAKFTGGGGRCMRIDNFGNIYTTGGFWGTRDFDPDSAGVFNLTTTAFYGAGCVSKLDSAGNFLWAKGMDNAGCVSMALDITGNTFVTGLFRDVASFDSIFISNSHSNIYNDIFIAKLSNCPSVSSIYTSSCYSYTSPSGNYTWTTAGTYKDTIPIAGCDSIIIIHLIINNSTTSTQTINACNSYTSPSGNYTWTNSGIYYDTIPNINGCDSLMTINLIINTLSTSSLQAITACDNYISPSGNYNWTSSGTYMDTITNAGGCDSIITINLTLINSTASSITDSACGSYISPSNNYTWTTSGIYHDTIPNAIGCDSVITIHLTVFATSSTLNISSCFSYTSPSGNYIYTASGTYTDTMPNILGCDSVITIHLIIKTINTTVIQHGDTLTAFAAGVVYQWLDCDNGFTPIAGAINKVYIATVNGNYAVEITQNGCIDTSACYTVTGVGINEINSSNSVQLFPNPATNHLTIVLPSNFKKCDVAITDLTGKIIYNIADASTQKIEVNTKDFSDGIYFVQIQTPDFVETKKLIIAN